MKNLIKILVIALVILTGCKTTKKMTDTSVNSSVSTEEIRSVKESKDIKEAKDINTELETTTEETVTEYYVPVKDSTLKSTTLVDKGPVKSVRTIRTVTTIKDADKSKVETSNEKQVDTNARTNDNTSVENKQTEKSKPATPWKLIIGIALLVMAGIVYWLIRKKVIKIPFFSKIN